MREIRIDSDTLRDALSGKAGGLFGQEDMVTLFINEMQQGGSIIIVDSMNGKESLLDKGDLLKRSRVKEDK